MLVVLALAAVLAVALTASSSRSSSTSPPSGSFLQSSQSGFDGAALPASGPAREFTLTNQAGRPVSLSRYRGEVTILAFLYSTCGATCILIAQQIRGALDELPHPVPVLFVTADPRSDTPARVARFLAQVSLSGRAEYLSGPPRALARAWRAYGVTPATDGRAAFERSPSVILLAPSGRERVVFGLEQLTPEGIAHDVRKLQA